MIRGTDRVSAVLELDEGLVDVFAAVSPAFERLRNPSVRRVMARLVTVEQAARMGGVDPTELLRRLNRRTDPEPAGDPHGGNHAGAPAVAAGDSGALAPHGIPAAMTVMLDVRDELRAGREPFSMIMAALRSVPDGGALCLRATFEPVPLYTVMRRHGLDHRTQRLADDDWRVWFFPEPAIASDDISGSEDVAESDDIPGSDDVAGSGDVAESDDVVILDVRGLEQPEPMMRTLAALEQLPAGATLVQINVRVPQFLLPLLDERGFIYEVREQSSDLVRLFITRRES